ncbi:MAG: ectoine/hydroxyectoine ABC transporter permease subunit EhuC [Actinomycetes bacterium]
MDFLSDVVTTLPDFQSAIVVTLVLTLGGAALALVVSFVFGLAASSPSVGIRTGSRVFVEFFRGTSLLVQLLWIFFALPFLGIKLEPMAAGIIALGLNYGAYGSEVVRGAVAAVPREQREAAVALSFSPVQRMYRVILPQAWVGMIPPFSNLLIQLLKGSALVLFITLSDITFEAQSLRQATGDSVLAYTVALVLYFVIAYAFTLLMNLLEVRAKRRVGLAPARRSLFRMPEVSEPVP